jgi:hypothetical protein
VDANRGSLTTRRRFLKYLAASPLVAAGARIAKAVGSDSSRSNASDSQPRHRGQTGMRRLNNLVTELAAGDRLASGDELALQNSREGWVYMACAVGVRFQ